MKGWDGLVGWPVADGLPTLVVTHQLQVECRTGKVLQSETDVLRLCYAETTRPIFTNFYCVLPMPVARSFSSGAPTCCVLTEWRHICTQWPRISDAKKAYTQSDSTGGGRIWRRDEHLNWSTRELQRTGTKFALVNCFAVISHHHHDSALPSMRRTFAQLYRYARTCGRYLVRCTAEQTASPLASGHRRNASRAQKRAKPTGIRVHTVMFCWLVEQLNKSGPVRPAVLMHLDRRRHANTQAYRVQLGIRAVRVGIRTDIGSNTVVHFHKSRLRRRPCA